MKFEWDDKKARTNVRKHGVSFDEALSVFFDPFAETISDPDHSEGERRFVSLGRTIKGRLVVVSHTDKNDVVRIISAREATRHERKSYES